MSIFQTSGSNDQQDPATVQTPEGTSEKATAVPASLTGAEKPPEGKEPNKEEPMVILDGPLGRIYTQALNLVYAKNTGDAALEDTGTMALIIDAVQKEKDETPIKGTHVYAMDASDITPADNLQVSNWMTKKKSQDCGDIIISLESHGGKVPKSDLIETMAKSIGAKVVYSRKSAMSVIDSKLKK